VVDVVIGVGSERGDDAAGLLVARRLRESGHPATIHELTGDLTRLLELWRPEDSVVVVDAVRSGALPGTVHVLDARATPLPAALAGTASTHGIGLDTVIELTRGAGRLPARLVVYGIEGSHWSAGERMSPEVSAAADRVVAILSRVSRSGEVAHR
jgi:hydrogenase maturation protease